MTWEYRVCRTENEGFELPEDQYSYSIHSVHYWGRDDTKIHLTSKDPRDPFGTTLEELTTDLELMTKALDKPFIDLDTLEYYEPTEEELNDESDYEDDDFDDDIPF